MTDKTYTHDEIIAKFLELRQAKSQVEDECKRRVAELQKRMDVIENYLLKTLQENNMESMRTKSGTCYIHTKTNLSVADREVFRQFVEQSGDLNLMNISANKTRVMEIFEETGKLAPGLNMHRTVTVGIRRGDSVGK